MSQTEKKNMFLKIKEPAAIGVSSLLPDKSWAKYESFYKQLTDWYTSKKMKKEANEKVIFPFFEEPSKKNKSYKNFLFSGASYNPKEAKCWY